MLLWPVGDLLGQALLYLEIAGKQLDDASEFGESQYAITGHVADMRDPVEWQEMVLAQRPERDVPDQNQLVVALLVGECGEVETLGGEQLDERRGNPPGGGGKMLVGGIPAQSDEQIPYGAFSARRIHCHRRANDR